MPVNMTFAKISSMVICLQTALAAIEALRKIDYRRGNLFLHTIHYLSDDFPIGKVGSSLSLPAAIRATVLLPKHLFPSFG